MNTVDIVTCGDIYIIYIYIYSVDLVKLKYDGVNTISHYFAHYYYYIKV